MDPRGTPFVRRADPRLRLRDYQTSVRRWLADPHVDRLILCENSGYDPAALTAFVDQANVYRKRVQVFSYRLAENATPRGKGYGELDLILHAVAQGGMAPPQRLLKVTGRYHVENMAEIAAEIQAHPDAATISCPPDPPQGIPSECFCATVSFLERFLAPAGRLIDDRRGFWFEHALAAAVENSVRAGHLHCVFRRWPHLVGISGSGNFPVGFRSAPGGIEIPLSPDYRDFLGRVLRAAPGGGESEIASAMAGRLLVAISPDMELVWFSHAEVAHLCECLHGCLREFTAGDFLARTGVAAETAAGLVRLLDRIMGHPPRPISP